MRHDALIIGGSFAGLSAATYIARARRSVCVVDAGRPRNRFAEHSHGFLSHDGSSPGDILSAARRQVAAYPTVSFVDGIAAAAFADDDGFLVEMETGEAIEARRLVLAFGISDELPDVPGLAERWGKSVIHCPYCHGYEFAGRRLGVLCGSPMSVHQAALVSEWGSPTFFLNGTPTPAEDALVELGRRGVTIEETPVAALHGSGTALSEVELADGRMIGIDALYVGPRNHLNSDIADQLGCAVEDLPLGRMIRADEFRATSVPKVFAAGDIVRGGHSVTWASSDGVMAGTALHRSLVFAAD